MGVSGPSKGCNSCREKKVKCDQKCPTCSRCERGGRHCVYRDEFDSAHRDQRNVAKASAEKKWRQRTSNLPVSGEAPTLNDNVVSDPPYGAPHVALHDPLHRLAYNRFRYDFVMPVTGLISPAKGTFSILDYLYPRASKDSCLYSAVTAVSCANFHGRLKSEEAKQASGLYYGKTLQKLATLMGMSPTTLNSDEILVTILVLGLYETLTSTQSDGFWMMHMRGTQSVIENRDIISNQGNHVVVTLCLHLLVYYISRRVAPPPHFHRWLEQAPVAFSHKARLADYMLETATLCAKLKTEFEVDGSFSDPMELLNAALSLDTHLKLWTSVLRVDRTYTVQEIEPTIYPPWAAALLSSAGAPRLMQVFSSPLAASDWNMYRATRIQLNLSILDFLTKSPESTSIVNRSGVKSQVLANIYTLTSDIASSIPGSLLMRAEGNGSNPASTEDIHGLWGYMLMWPISIAFSCYKNHDIADNNFQRQWFSTVLQFIRDSLGIAKAEVFLTSY